MSEAEGIRKDLVLVSRTVERALGSLGPGAEKARKVLGLLEEARQWLAINPRSKPVKAPQFRHPWPEALLFWALGKLEAVRGRLAKLTHSPKVKAEVFHVRDLTEAAHTLLHEAWLEFLRAHGLPPNFQPLCSLPLSGGFLTYFLLALGFAFASRVLKGEGDGSLWWVELLPAAWMIVTQLLMRLVLPRRSRNAPLLLPKGLPLRRVALGTLLALLPPGLGILLFPERAALLGVFGLAGLVVAGSYLVPSARIVLFPKNVRVLFLPGYWVVFGESLSPPRKGKVFKQYFAL
ncbi:MAG: hypothetical protein ACP5LK_02765 [Candidatus Bipolaricaulaceae bacterium]